MTRSMRGGIREKRLNCVENGIQMHIGEIGCEELLVWISEL